ncbi:hypothetical protein JCGZ_14192 [Jatropha curcas]|uniref:DUF4228 domain-containing protein n=1 Tax=Jatropha curcas TaxID=180498 RepID=A0A067JWR9_JATCU|nr:uncharacterized protein LOC105642780 [Jatropha curcas]KDP28421.1 hypothetical protein JCGZ_14192 [Jatropha curcas]
MGNCVFRGFGVMEEEEMIKVVTTNGGIMELYAPITAESITNEFPGHAIYRSRDVSPPLLHNEVLQAGHLYYLLPMNASKLNAGTATAINSISNCSSINSSTSSKSKLAPYRMSFDNQRYMKRLTEAEVFPRYNSTGVWKVKLVISPEQLTEILAQEARTEELIENVRTVAKCGNGLASNSVANSDQWSVATSQ